MKKSKGYASIEVMILGIITMIIVNILIQGANNMSLLINSEKVNNHTNIKKYSDQYEFLNKFFINIYSENVNQLLIEDSTLNIEVIESILGRNGFTVGRFNLTYNKNTDLFKVVETVSYTKKINYYYDYYFNENKLILKKRIYYEYQ